MIPLLGEGDSELSFVVLVHRVVDTGSDLSNG